MEERTKECDLLTEWLEDFKSKLGEYEEAHDTIHECKHVRKHCKKAMKKARIPLMVKTARDARRADGSCLEYGLEYHSKNMKNAVGSLYLLLLNCFTDGTFS